ncbi:peptidase M20 family protein [Caenibius tardaugens NBRC 16725]|uniref:Peptidase M20 family protein n=1 Tax=Caenibius tardaugens NBRC 16725 TaxID=1219035 RepID=U2ZXY3_9SPHN|nr:amidohydrolase [Caenibius tardaugens]AZI37367.1 amidohydrolase [Caenibius tardaugens NBRC 16725]GAD47373.1 peptidase M20 family protein [Caenibius tardaugens NBRC 16725]
MRLKWTLAALGLMASANAHAQATAADVAANRTAIDAIMAKNAPDLIALYKDLHAHPELGFQEKATAAKLAKLMRAIGFKVTEGVGGTGIVAVLRNGEGPSILVRTDLDGLPMQERTGLPYASKATGTYNGKITPVAHSCGHDIHMAAWIGAARALAAMKDKWNGTLIFVGQPAEETVSGARAMLDDGFVERFGKADYGFALHVAPAPAGTILYRSGAMTSTSDSLELTFHGRGGHGSAPATTIDPVMMAARFTVDVQSVISREKEPEAFGVVTIGAIQAGEAGNVIPDRALLRGTIRTQNERVREKILDGVNRTAKAVASMAGAPEPTLVTTLGGKMVVNDAALTARTVEVFKAAFGPQVQPMPIAMSGSEDFSEFILAGTPSVFFLVGGLDKAVFDAGMKSGKLAINHSPEFAPLPEPTISVGATAMTLAVLNVAQPKR